MELLKRKKNNKNLFANSFKKGWVGGKFKKIIIYNKQFILLIK